MIDSVDIKGFQAHKRKHIDFTPGVNVIIGDSDKGKSAIYRAIKWVATGRPQGDSVITHGKKNCTVTVQSNGNIITRQKGKENKYVLNDAEFKAMRSDVPEEVIEALNLKEINFQSQHDNAFMLSETAGEVGRMLNKMVDLTVIDSLLKGLNKKQKQAKDLKHFEENTLKDLKERKKSLVPVTDAIEDFKVIEIMDGNICEKDVTIDNITQCIESIKVIRDDMVIIPDSIHQELSVLSDSHCALVEQVTKHNEVRRLVDDITILDDLVKPDDMFTEAHKEFDEITQTVIRGAEVSEKRKALANAVNEVKILNLTLRETLQDINDWQAQYDDAEKEIPVCATCGQILQG